MNHSRVIKRRLSIRPLFHQTDMMGVIHNAQYFLWFEEGRLQIATEILPIAEAINRHVAMPVVENVCRYHKPVRYGAELVLSTTHRIQSAYEGRLEFEHSLVDAHTKTEAASGVTVATLVDWRSGQLIKDWPVDIWQRYQKLL